MSLPPIAHHMTGGGGGGAMTSTEAALNLLVLTSAEMLRQTIKYAATKCRRYVPHTDSISFQHCSTLHASVEDMVPPVTAASGGRHIGRAKKVQKNGENVPTCRSEHEMSPYKKQF